MPTPIQISHPTLSGLIITALEYRLGRLIVQVQDRWERNMALIFSDVTALTAIAPEQMRVAAIEESRTHTAERRFEFVNAIAHDPAHLMLVARQLTVIPTVRLTSPLDQPPALYLAAHEVTWLMRAITAYQDTLAWRQTDPATPSEEAESIPNDIGYLDALKGTLHGYRDVMDAEAWRTEASDKP